MVVYPDIDPVAVRVFGFPVHWYGLMYLLGLGLAAAAGRRALARTAMFADAGGVRIMDFVTAAALGVIAGGRLGYVVFYKFADYMREPLSVFYLWQGGMSFHGGLIGAVLAMAVYARLARAPFLRLTDLAALLAPPGLGLGRVGNFIGGELPGRVASEDLPWAMVFRHIDDLPRHPSQLYQAFLEGFVLTVLMHYFAGRGRRRPGWLSAMFLICYGGLRFFSEFFREPDAHLGLLLFGLSRGQWLSLPMIALGAGLLVFWRLRTVAIAPNSRAASSPLSPVAATVADAETTPPDSPGKMRTAAAAFFAFAGAAASASFALPARFFAFMRGDDRAEENEEWDDDFARAEKQKRADDGNGDDDDDDYDDDDADDDYDEDEEEDDDDDDEEEDDDDEYGDDDDEEEEEEYERASGGGRLWRFFFAEDDDDGETETRRRARLSRREKRRMKKKKRR